MRAADAGLHDAMAVREGKREQRAEHGCRETVQRAAAADRELDAVLVERLRRADRLEQMRVPPDARTDRAPARRRIAGRRCSRECRTTQRTRARPMPIDSVTRPPSRMPPSCSSIRTSAAGVSAASAAGCSCQRNTSAAGAPMIEQYVNVDRCAGAASGTARRAIRRSRPRKMSAWSGSTPYQ